MKKINDERLKIQNLKNIRLAHIVQTLGIIGILIYDLAKGGMEKMAANPLWFVLLITGITTIFLHMAIGVDYEDRNRNPDQGLKLSLLIILVISLLIGSLLARLAVHQLKIGIIGGIIAFISGLVPSLYIYKLRLKNRDR